MAVPYPGANISPPSRDAHTAHPRLLKSKSESLRRRLFATADGHAPRQSENAGATPGEDSDWEKEGKAICTTPGMACAGETETETDEPVSFPFFFFSFFSPWRSHLTVVLVVATFANGTFPESLFPPVDFVFLVGKQLDHDSSLVAMAPF